MNLDLMSAADIAEALRLKLRTVRDTLVRRPDFPAPLVVGGSKRWIKSEVQQWMLRQRKTKK
jgi:predicted DNA-binding transcriptional regulator AlpA